MRGSSFPMDKKQKVDLWKTVQLHELDMLLFELQHHRARQAQFGMLNSQQLSAAHTYQSPMNIQTQTNTPPLNLGGTFQSPPGDPRQVAIMQQAARNAQMSPTTTETRGPSRHPQSATPQMTSIPSNLRHQIPHPSSPAAGLLPRTPTKIQSQMGDPRSTTQMFQDLVHKIHPSTPIAVPRQMSQFPMEGRFGNNSPVSASGQISQTPSNGQLQALNMAPGSGARPPPIIGTPVPLSPTRPVNTNRIISQLLTAENHVGFLRMSQGIMAAATHPMEESGVRDAIYQAMKIRRARAAARGVVGEGVAGRETEGDTD
jgi:hypothetical protein